MITAGWTYQTAFAVALFFVTALALILLRPLLPIDETRYLTVAWEMWVGGSKLVPHLNGEIYGHKPPLLFWLINGVWWVTGISELAARLVAPFFAALSVMLTALLARRFWPDAPERAGRAALILATSGVVLAFGSAVMFDALLTVATLLSIWALWGLSREVTGKLIAGLAIGLAFGVLAKGPVILVHVLPAALLMPVWADPSLRPDLRRYYGAISLAVIAALVIVLIWLGPALVLGGAAYRDEVLWKQTAGRMVASFAHDRPFWFFLVLLPLFLWPWGWGGLTVRAFAPSRLLRDPASRLLLIWAGSALVAFSAISGKQIHYLVPEMPAIALLLAGGSIRTSRAWTRLLPMLPAVLLIGGGIAISAGIVPTLAEQGIVIGALQLALATVIVAGSIMAILRIAANELALLVIAPVTLIAAEFLAAQTLWQTNDPARIGAELAAHTAQGLATTDMNYAGEFTFTARLTAPITELAGADAVQAWSAANPGGLILVKGALEAPGLIQIAGQKFHSTDYALYEVAARP